MISKIDLLNERLSTELAFFVVVAKRLPCTQAGLHHRLRLQASDIGGGDVMNVLNSRFTAQINHILRAIQVGPPGFTRTVLPVEFKNCGAVNDAAAVV